jgi:hypothetical protein
MSINTILQKLLFVPLVLTILAVLPVAQLFCEWAFKDELIDLTKANLTQGISKREFFVNAQKATLIKNLSRPESTSKLLVILLLNFSQIAPRTALSSTILLL